MQIVNRFDDVRFSDILIENSFVSHCFPCKITINCIFKLHSIILNTFCRLGLNSIGIDIVANTGGHRLKYTEAHYPPI